MGRIVVVSIGGVGVGRVGGVGRVDVGGVGIGGVGVGGVGHCCVLKVLLLVVVGRVAVDPNAWLGRGYLSVRSCHPGQVCKQKT